MKELIKEHFLPISDALKENVLELEHQIDTAHGSNAGGWQGVIRDIFNDLSWIKDLRQSIEALSNKKTERFWFNINRPGEYNKWHQHFPDGESCVLYIKVPKNSGDIVFRKDTEHLTITPKEGMIIIFPGWLEHQVLENKSSDTRISLATNFIRTK